MSKRENFYRRDPSKALSGMIGLSLEERGVYNTVLDLLYSTWRPIEDDRRFIANWCGCAVQKLNPILNRLIETGRLITFVEGSRTYVSDEAFEAERTAVKGAAPTRSGRAKVEEKSGEVGEKSADVGQNLPLLDTDNAGNQSVTALEKRRQDKKEPPNPQGGEAFNAKPFAKALEIAAGAGCAFPALVDRIHKAQPVVDGKRRSTAPDVQRALTGALKRGGIPSAIWAAVQNFYALPASTKDGGQYANGAAVVLNADRWKEYAAPAAEESAPAPSTFNAPQVRASIVHATDEDFARRWVDHYCRWEPEARRLEARTPAVAAALAKSLAGWAERNSVTIAVAAANDGAALKQTGEAA